MKNKRGFTLIELLSVIVILGLLMAIAIPSVTRYILYSRKRTYIVTAKNFITGASNLVNEGELSIYDPNTTYYIPGSCISTEKGGKKSPFAEWDKMYVAVTFSGNGFDYYWTSTDKAKMGIKLAYGDSLDINCIKSNIDGNSINTNIGIGNRKKIVVFADDGLNCTSRTTSLATVNVPEKVKCDYDIPKDTTTIDGLTWRYKNLKMDFSKLTGSDCDNINGVITCYGATVRVENLSDDEVIKSYVATFTIPSGVSINTQYDPNMANVSINGSTLTIVGNPNNLSYRYLNPHDYNEYSFKFSYSSTTNFKLSNGQIQYDVLNSDHQDGESSGDPEHISSTVQKLKIELDRTTIYESGGYHQAQYDLKITNLSNESITDWSVVFDMPDEIVNFTTYNPLKVTKNNNRYILTAANYSPIGTIGAGETIGPYQVQFAMTDTNAIPTIR